MSFEKTAAEVHFGRCFRFTFARLGRRPHHHSEYHEMLLIIEGELHTDINQEKLIGKTGDILFYPMGVQTWNITDRCSGT